MFCLNPGLMNNSMGEKRATPPEVKAAAMNFASAFTTKVRVFQKKSRASFDFFNLGHT
jgi:hypothetical protein